MTDNPYKDYFELMPAYLTILDRDLRIVEANRRFRRGLRRFRGAVLLSDQSAPVGALRALSDGAHLPGRVASRDGREIHQQHGE